MTVISTNGETRDGMHQYLSRLGAEVRSTGDLSAVAKPGKEAADILILFADDYAREDAAAAARAALASLPKASVIVVTGDESAFRKALGRVERIANLVLLCRPVWGWAMADAIRAQLARRAPRRDT